MLKMLGTRALIYGILLVPILTSGAKDVRFL